MGFPEPVGAAPGLWLPEVREWEAFMTGEWAEESNGPEAEQLLWPKAQDTSKGFSLSSPVKPLSRQWLHHCISRGKVTQGQILMPSGLNLGPHRPKFPGFQTTPTLRFR